MTRWHDTALSPGERADALLAAMTLEEKIAQLGSAWPGNDEVSGNVAPMLQIAGGPHADRPHHRHDRSAIRARSTC